jgi:hypothetical protein
MRPLTASTGRRRGRAGSTGAARHRHVGVREKPALLKVGDLVRFVSQAASEATHGAATPVASAAQALAVPSGAALRFEAVGPQALLQDGGRKGRAWQGVSASGAMDMKSLRVANRHVGNAPGEAYIEMANGGYRVVSCGHTVVAISGEEGELVLQGREGNRRRVARDEALALDDGDTLYIAKPEAGVRSYLAVRGASM